LACPPVWAIMPDDTQELAMDPIVHLAQKPL